MLKDLASKGPIWHHCLGRRQADWVQVASKKRHKCVRGTVGVQEALGRVGIGMMRNLCDEMPWSKWRVILVRESHWQSTGDDPETELTKIVWGSQASERHMKPVRKMDRGKKEKGCRQGNMKNLVERVFERWTFCSWFFYKWNHFVGGGTIIQSRISKPRWVCSFTSIKNCQWTLGNCTDYPRISISRKPFFQTPSAGLLFEGGTWAVCICILNFVNWAEYLSSFLLV